MMGRVSFLLLLAWTVIIAGEAPVLSSLLGDHAVLQRGRPIRVAGSAPPGAEVTVRLAGEAASARSDGAGAWSVELPALPAGGPYDLEAASGGASTVAHELMVGDVWLCAGQSNMAFALRDAAESTKRLQEVDGAPIRLFKPTVRIAASPQADFAAGQPGWSTCTAASAATFSAVSLAFARRVQADEPVTIGLIQAAKAGSFIEAWIPGEVLAADPAYAPILRRWAWLDDRRETLQAAWTSEHALWQRANGERFAAWRLTPVGGPFRPHEPWPPPPQDSFLRPAVLWNGVVAPLTRMPLRGVLWYQGESNSDRAWQYRFLLRSLITGWRQAWGDAGLPVVIAQLPEYETDCCPYDHQDAGAWEVLRESQAIAATLPATGLAVTLGLGDRRDIHPRAKWPVGERLGRVALAVAYGRDLAWTGPRLAATTREGGRLVLRFSGAGTGLVTLDGGPVVGCAIAGADRRFVPARAEIIGPDTLGLSAPGIAEPVAARYAWDDAPSFNLTGGDGLMAGPFRSDDWPVPTQDALLPFGQTWPEERP